MAKLYKVSFWVSLIIIAILFNFLRTSKAGYEKDLKLIRQLTEKRLSSLLGSNTLIKRILKPIKGENIITKKLESDLLHDTVLVILLDKFKCSRCQEKELVRLNSLRKSLELKGIKVIGITTLSQKDAVIRQRKVSQINFAIFWVKDETFFNNLAVHKEFPQILLVSNHLILSAFIPIPQDDKFSEDFYKDLLSRI